MNIRKIVSYFPLIIFLVINICGVSCKDNKDEVNKNIFKSERTGELLHNQIKFVNDSIFNGKIWRLVGTRESGPPSSRADSLKNVFTDDQSLIKKFVNTIQYWQDTSIDYCSGYHYNIYLTSDKGDKIDAGYWIGDKYAITLIYGEYFLFDANLWFEIQEKCTNLTKVNFEISEINKARTFYQYIDSLKVPKYHCYISLPSNYPEYVNPDSTFMSYDGCIIISFSSTKLLRKKERKIFLDSVLKEALNTDNFYFDSATEFWNSNSYSYKVVVFCNKLDTFNSDKIELSMKWEKIKNINLKVYTNDPESLQSYYKGI